MVLCTIVPCNTSGHCPHHTPHYCALYYLNLGCTLQYKLGPYFKLINIHKNNKYTEDPEFFDSKPYIQYVNTEGLTREYIQQGNNTLILDELMEHFWGLHESFIKFAYCHHRFQSLTQEDQKVLLDRNSLLFIMVSN